LLSSGNREKFSLIGNLSLLAAFLIILAAQQALAADSLAVKLNPYLGRGPMPNRLGHKPFKPLLTIKSATKSQVEYDLKTGSVVETISLPTQNGEMVLGVEYWSVLDYLENSTSAKDDSLFNAISADYVSGQANARLAQDRGLMPEINLPDFMPKSLASIIGEGTGSLVIHGQSVTEVSGTTTFQIPEDQSLFRQQSKFPRLKLEQRQQINIEGTIGTKIHIFVDYNSQNQFENRNRIEVRYQGEEDEILQKRKVLESEPLELPVSSGTVTDIDKPKAAESTSNDEKTVLPGGAKPTIIDETIEQDDLLHNARQAYWDKNYQQSIRLYQKLVEREPDNADFSGELGNVYYAMNDYSHASRMYYRAARLLLSQGRHDAARQLLSPVTAMDRERGDRLRQLLME